MSVRQGLRRAVSLHRQAQQLREPAIWAAPSLPCTGLCLRQLIHAQASLLAAAEAAAAPAPAPQRAEEQDEEAMSELTPRQVVEKLDRYIVGQGDAKRAVANALRNRWRRHKVPSPMKEDIVPKNILMIGPTGCGKTEIARRLAKLADAPFVKVEATKFTEVGFHGRDVDQIIRDLVDNAVVQTRAKLRRTLRRDIERATEERLLDALVGPAGPTNQRARDEFRRHLRSGEVDDRVVDIEVPNQRGVSPVEGLPGVAMQEFVVRVDKILSPRRSEQRKLKISEARPLIEDMETEKLISSDTVTRDAVQAVEQDGIVFLDEIDKIVTSSDLRYGADASSEGVQRDLLPIIEGSTVSTKYGNVNTDHILFICSGAFHQCKPSDMLAELQGRLPIRVELKGLTRKDFYRILTEPENNMIKQQAALLATEGVRLSFSDAAIHEIARVAEDANAALDNIGARRLHTVLERILDEISFSAPDMLKEAQAAGRDTAEHRVTKAMVVERVGDLLQRQDLSKYVL